MSKRIVIALGGNALGKTAAGAAPAGHRDRHVPSWT